MTDKQIDSLFIVIACVFLTSIILNIGFIVGSIYVHCNCHCHQCVESYNNIEGGN